MLPADNPPPHPLSYPSFSLSLLHLLLTLPPLKWSTQNLSLNYKIIQLSVFSTLIIGKLRNQVVTLRNAVVMQHHRMFSPPVPDVEVYTSEDLPLHSSDYGVLEAESHKDIQQ